MIQIIKKKSALLIGIIFLVISFSFNTASFAADNSFSKKQNDEINQMIRDYILQNPEILPQAIGILQNRQKATVLTQNHTALYEDGFSYIGGNLKGNITLIEFFDYNCGYCKQALEIIEKLKREDKNLRIIYKELPILSETSNTAAKAAMASMKQGKYAQFHHALLKNRSNLTESRIFEIARTVGLNEQTLAKDMTNPILNKNIQTNRNLAQIFDISGTPGFIIGDTIIAGSIPYEKLVKIIDKARHKNAP